MPGLAISVPTVKNYPKLSFLCPPNLSWILFQKFACKNWEDLQLSLVPSGRQFCSVHRWSAYCVHTYCVYSAVGNPGGTTGVLVFQAVTVVMEMGLIWSPGEDVSHSRWSNFEQTCGVAHLDQSPEAGPEDGKQRHP